jgi:hypothetical protein
MGCDLASTCSLLPRQQLIWLLALLLCAGAGARAARPTSVTLAQGGKARMPVVVSDAASPAVRQAADALASTLRRMTGAAFAVETGDGTLGIAVGLAIDFPALRAGVSLDTKDPTRREDYLLRTHTRGVYLLGVTEVAVQYAVWDLLYRLGYRQYFPGPTWEVVPAVPAPRLGVDMLETPDFIARRIWYEYGNFRAPDYNDWCVKNRVGAGIALNTGHAYDQLVERHKEVFTAHPEYLALVNGKRRTVTERPLKFCISNPGLRDLVVADCLRRFDDNPALDSTSLDPSDGGGWCECDACGKMGSVSDRVVILANEAAAAVAAKYPGKYIGMYAYYMHSPPPTVRVHPNVIMSVATSFIQGGYTFEQLIEGWAAQGATLGIRDYYSVIAWSRDLPGSAIATNLDNLEQRIRYHHRTGARYVSTQTDDSWGPLGLGHYFAARMLWDVRAGERRQAIVDDFFTRCFGPAQQPMRAFYALIDGGNDGRPQLSDHLLGLMYRRLHEARALTGDPLILARIDDLALYTRYVELFFDYLMTGDTAQYYYTLPDRYVELAFVNEDGNDAERLRAFEKVIRFTHSIRERGMVFSHAIYRDLRGRDRAMTVPLEYRWDVPEEQNPWKRDPAPTPAQIARFIEQGVERFATVELPRVAYSDRLARAKTPKGIPEPAEAAGNVTRIRQRQRFYCWLEAPRELEIRLTGKQGLRGPQEIAVRLLAGQAETPADQAIVQSDNTEYTVTLRARQPGLHCIEVNAGGALTTVTWPADLPLTIKGNPLVTRPDGLYFYVPKGTRMVAGFAWKYLGGAMRDARGDTVLDFSHMTRNGYFSIPVPPGQDGAVWSLHGMAGIPQLLNVPPYFATDARALLLPREVR